MKSKRNRSSKPLLSLPSPLIVAAVGIICITYVQLSQSAAITVQDIKSSNKSDQPVSHSVTKQESKGSAAKPNKPRVEVHVQVGRMKASDIKACISKAFCEVNSVSKVPNYAVNQEFFDLMNQIHAMSNEELDSGSASAEYDDDEEDDDDDASSEESSSERLRGYPPRPGMPPPPGYRLGKNLKDGQNDTLSLTSTNTTLTDSQSGDKKKIKKTDKKKLKLGQKVLKKFANGTLVTLQKHRRSRLETAEEKAEKQAYLSRKQREMGQVGDLAALIRISSDIGLTIRNYKKCRSLFTKCTMSHDQVMDLFNQTLMAVASPNTSSPEPEPASPVPTTQRAKVTTAALEVMSSPTTLKSQLDTKRPAMIFKSTSAPVVITTVAAPSTISADDGNRSSKSRHEFSDEEDVEYLTETELNQPVYALFVNDAPEDTVKTAEEINVQETFKKYANTFPSETLIQADIPSLRKSGNKGKSLKKNGSSSRSSKSKQIAKRRQTSSEEDEDDDEDEEDDDAGSMSMEAQPSKINFRVDPYHGYGGSSKHSVEPSDPYHGYRENSEHGAESSEPFSIPKDSGELPPLVKKQKPKQNEAEEEEDDEDDSEESGEAEADEPKKTAKSKSKLQAKKKSGKPSKPAPVEEEESSEEDEVEAAEDEPQVPPPWTPVYQMYMTEKQKQGHKKKQKGPYKGGEGPYSDIPIHHGSSHSSTSKKPWGGSSSSLEVGPPSSHESPYGDLPYHHGHYGNGPLPSSQEAGGPGGPGEQKPGFFQSIMSWFTGNKNPNADQSSGQLQDDPYAGHAYGQHPYGMQPGSAELHQDELPEDDLSATGAPWPAQPDPAGLGHFGRNPQYRLRNPDSSEEDDDLEEVLVEEPVVSKRGKKNKRRYRGRSDSIITSPPKKKQPVKKSTSNGGPPPPVVITPKEKQQVAGVYEPNHSYDKLMQADGGSNPGRRKVAHSDKENKRTKKAAVKNQQKKSKKQKQRGQSHRTSRESTEDDDEAFSSEELYNQQVAKLKAGNQQVMLGGNSNSNNQRLGNKPNKNGESFPTYFESMFGSGEQKEQYQVKGKDDGSLLYGFESLSSHLSPTPLDLSVVANKKKTSSYKVNKNKKKNKKGTESPVRFNNKEVVESSEEEEKKRK